MLSTIQQFNVICVYRKIGMSIHTHRHTHRKSETENAYSIIFLLIPIHTWLIIYS